MAAPPLPPIEERDGSLARANATDAADWHEVRSANGHPYHFPPEIAYLAGEGAVWDELEALLRPALIARERAATRPPEAKTVQPTTLCMAAALGAYAFHVLETPDLSDRELARRTADFAALNGLDGGEPFNPEGSTMKRLAGAILDAIRKSRP